MPWLTDVCMRHSVSMVYHGILDDIPSDFFKTLLIRYDFNSMNLLCISCGLIENFNHHLSCSYIESRPFDHSKCACFTAWALFHCMYVYKCGGKK